SSTRGCSRVAQISFATFVISVFHCWHEAAFDLAVVRRVSHCNGACHNKLRSGGKGNELSRGRSPPKACHSQRKSLYFSLLNQERSRHDVRWRRWRHARGDG